MSPPTTVDLPLQTYVVRIYRRDDRQPASVSGTVEPVPGEERLPFGSLGQLGAILALPVDGAAAETPDD